MTGLWVGLVLEVVAAVAVLELAAIVILLTGTGDIPAPRRRRRQALAIAARPAARRVGGCDLAVAYLPAAFTPPTARPVHP